MYIAGIDVGGTFTDVVLLDEASGTIKTAKVPSTPANQSIGLLRGLEGTGVPVDELQKSLKMIVHGTTVATNAVLQRRGAVCGLITTKGFRDILELRRRDRPHTYGLKGTFEPLIPRDKRLEVTERTDWRGEVLEPVNEEEVEACAHELLRKGVEAVVVSFLHSYANPSNEQRARKVIEKIWPNPYIVIASEILPELREFERTSTVVVNAYVQPLIDRYLFSLEQQLKEKRYQSKILLIQSNGGIMSVEVSRRFSVNTVLSGPAAGVIAAKAIGESAGFSNIITCDMGGTSLDVCLVSKGESAVTSEILLTYGVPIRVQMLGIKSIGAGGGSIVWIDRAGILQVGPQSAGADPGPACYGRGGREPTVTDANLVLGRLGATSALGSDRTLQLDVAKAENAIKERVASPLGLSLLEATRAIIEVTNAKIAGNIRLVSVERGHDPREFVLVAFGGAGPLHASALIREIGLSKVIIPYYPGLTSALGCIMADVRHDFLQTINRRLDDIEMADIHEVFRRDLNDGLDMLQKEGIKTEQVLALFRADMSYEGQIHKVLTILPSATPSREEIIAAFKTRYCEEYGNPVDNRPIQVTTLRCAIIGVRPKIVPKWPASEARLSLKEALQGTRSVYVDKDFVKCPIYRRERLSPGVSFSGPAIVEQTDATTFVDHGMLVRVDTHGNQILQQE